jgi:ABC-2 type transport system ATP-binding protein
LLKISNLSYKYPRGEEIFDDLSLEIKAGEFWILLGQNGSGKSTLINLLLGLRTPVSGSISVLGLDPQLDSVELRKKMFFISHSITHNENSSIKFILENYSILYSNYDTELENELLDLFGLDCEQCMFQLSLGQKSRVQIIAAIASNTPLILIDEISAVLDPMARDHLAKALLNERNKGRSILMATNIPDDSSIDADKIISIKHKKIKNYEK